MCEEAEAQHRPGLEDGGLLQPAREDERAQAVVGAQGVEALEERLVERLEALCRRRCAACSSRLTGCRNRKHEQREEKRNEPSHSPTSIGDPTLKPIPPHG